MGNVERRIHFVSLGCARNLVDSEVMLGVTVAAGFEVVSDPAEADVIVVNTCGFIDAAKQESVDTILAMADFKEVGRCRTLVVTGCLTQRYAEELTEEMPEVDYFLGTGEFPRIAEILEERPPVRGFFRRPKFLYGEATPRIHSGPAHSAWLKIAEGCSTRCAFCIIPKLRGPLRSRPIDSVVVEAERLAEQGVRELNIIAQDSTDYGRDLNEPDALPRLLQRLDAIDTLRWIRVLYCYPDKITEALVDTIAGGGRLVPYLDMPVQHADDEVLARMNRSVTADRIHWAIEQLRSRIPALALRTSVIVGFPGETDAQFERLLAFLEKTNFDHVGVFKYSREEGTAADRLDGHLPEAVIQGRYDAATALLTELSRKRLAARVGRVCEVMIDGLHPDSDWVYVGRMPTQAPEVDGQVAVTRGPDAPPDATPLRPGDLVHVRIQDSAAHDLAGEVLEDHAIDPAPTPRRPLGVGIATHPEPGRTSSKLEVLS